MEVKQKPTTPSTIGTPSEELLKLESYIETKNNDEWITYTEIKTNLKIDIRTPAGRSLFYTALKRLNRECINQPNYGYKLSSVGTALPIVDSKIIRVGGAIKRTLTATENVNFHHKKEMTDPQRQAIELTAFGAKAMLGKVQSQRKVIKKEMPQLSEVNPVV